MMSIFVVFTHLSNGISCRGGVGSGFSDFVSASDQSSEGDVESKHNSASEILFFRKVKLEKQGVFEVWFGLNAKSVYTRRSEEKRSHVFLVKGVFVFNAQK